MTQGRTVNQSLNDSDGHSFAPKSEVSCGCIIELPPGLKFIFKHGSCNTLGVCHSLSSGFELKYDRLSGDDDGKVNLRR
jgi:hypothetical protein